MSEETATSITSGSGSNLALAFMALPVQRRRDITVFYAFCRKIDDITDDASLSISQKQEGLDRWRHVLSLEKSSITNTLENDVLDLLRRYPIQADHLFEILDGVAMDLNKNRYATFEELKAYCHKVASVVGLVSIEIFGYQNPQCRRYAESLGLALQLTNILRDIAVDLEDYNRIYLPVEEMEQFGVTESALHSKVADDRFLNLMEFQATRAYNYYREAKSLLPSQDKQNMVAPEIMRNIYLRLLERMQADDFRVFEKHYRLSRMEKLWLIFRTRWLG